MGDAVLTWNTKLEVLLAVFSRFFAFLKSYLFRLGFLDGAMGLAVCILQAQAAYGKYFTLYCLSQGKK